MKDDGRARAIRIHPEDSVAVAVTEMRPGDRALGVPALERIPAGHKMALHAIGAGQMILKYGSPIGHATRDISKGAWVHTHNAATNLSGVIDYAYHPAPVQAATPLSGTFRGYPRPDGRPGIRNELWILPTVSCVNGLAERVAAAARDRHRRKIDGVYAFPHPYGCSQVGEDLQRTRALLAALSRHPNAGGALLLGLGCENNEMDALLHAIGPRDEGRVRWMLAQDVEDEAECASRLIDEIVDQMAGDERVELPSSGLSIGLKCGGSDGFSGLTANPLIGRLADGHVAAGGGALLTEVPEMFGAEQLLMNRAVDERVFSDVVDMIDRYKRYFLGHGEAISDNPSPGNKAGGLTTLEDKSLGCTQKGGQCPVTGVLDYAERAGGAGLYLVYGPGNDGCAITALTAAGAQLILFSTGRGTPMGAPAPTLKLSTNTALYQKKPHWIDFDAGSLAFGADIDDEARVLHRLILDTASGAPARNETNGYREIAIFKDGVTE